MASIKFLGDPKVQYWNPTTQDFLVGGQLFSYAPGGLTPTNTYSTIADATAGTNPNTNPVILDATGSATVVISGGVMLVLQDSLGNQIWAIDNINISANTVLDNNGNPILLFNTVANAVNEITISNASAGAGPIIAATGSDPNIGLNIDVQGVADINLNTGLSGTTAIQGNASVAGNITCSGINTVPLMKGGLNILPAGIINWYAGSTAPNGWLICTGQAISRTTYSSLFTAIGTIWGVGDGSTTFNLPNQARSTLVGVGGTNTSGTLGTTVGSTGGAETVAISTANMPAGVATNPGTILNVNAALTSGSDSIAYSGNASWGQGSATALPIMPIANREKRKRKGKK